MKSTWARMAARFTRRGADPGTALHFNALPGTRGAWWTRGGRCCRLSEIQPPGLPYYRLARLAADDAIRELHGCFPGLLGRLVPFDFTPTYRLHLTYRYAAGDVPAVLSWLHEARATRGRALLVNSLLSADTVEHLHAEANHAPLPIPIGLELAVGEPGIQNQLEHMLAFPVRADRAAVSQPEPGSVLVFIGSGRDLNLVLPLLAGLPPKLPIAGILKKSDAPLEAELRDAIHGNRPFTTTYEALMGGDRGCSRAAAILKSLFECHDRVAQGGSAGAHLSLHLLQLADLLRLALPLLELLEQSRPSIVVGAFEKSFMGAFLSGACRMIGARLVNLQHGLVPGCPCLDLVRFDDFVVWDETSAANILDAGYAHPDTLRIIGNPGWQMHWNGPAPSSQPAQPGPYLEWKGSDRLLTVFTQPAKWPFVTAEDTRVFLRALGAYLESAANVKLLIKQHEREPVRDYPEEIRQLIASDRVRVAAYEDLPFDEALRLADAVVSISSTAILDAVAAGKPSVACNLTGGHERSSLRLPPFVPVAAREGELFHLLDRALRGESTAEPEILFKWCHQDARGYAAAAAKLAVTGMQG